MKNTFTNLPNTSKINLNWVVFILFLASTFCMLPKANAQSVSQPVSDISTTYKKYSYTYKLSETQKKEIEYIIVKASNGDIKTVFNACDVCYAAHKGYSQTGTELRCNNCGNRFPIDGLGMQGTGGTCNPGYLPHTIEGSNVVIQVADLIKGAYFYLTQAITSVNDETASQMVMIRKNDNMTVKMQSIGDRNFRLISMNGQLISSFSNTSDEVQFNTSDLALGIYILSISENGLVTNKVFCIY